jgi:uncharacterized delta-60 repeat protein
MPTSSGSHLRHARCNARAFLVLLAAAAQPACALAPGQIGATLTFPVSNAADNAYAAAINPDGTLLIAGSGNSGGYGVLARVTAGGAADLSFAPNGYIVEDLSTNLADSLRALVRTSDGHYVACGTYFSVGTATDFVTARFTSAGALVSYVVTPYLASGSGAVLYDQCNAVGVQSDGKVVSAGYTQADGSERVMVTRHTTDDVLDSSFAGGGKVKIDASLNPAADSSAQALVVLPDDKLLIAGNAGGTFNNIEFLLMRLNADGTPDDTFGTNGIVRTPIGTGTDIANALLVQPDGRIVVAGSSVAADGRADFAVARYSEAGVLDTTFGGGAGFVTTPVGPGEDIPYAVLLMPWGRIVAAGSARISTSSPGTDIAVVAYNADGTLDKYFGSGGKVMVQLGMSADEVIYALAVDISHTHFWAAGAGVPGTNRDLMVLEFGLPDTIFRYDFEVPAP